MLTCNTSQIIALGAAYIVAVTALDTVTNVGAIDDLTSIARIVLVRAPPHLPWHRQHRCSACHCTGAPIAAAPVAAAGPPSQGVAATERAGSSEQVLPVAVLDGIFIFWVFHSLSKTLAQLQTRRAGAKLELYRCIPPQTGASAVCCSPADLSAPPRAPAAQSAKSHVE